MTECGEPVALYGVPYGEQYDPCSKPRGHDGEHDPSVTRDDLEAIASMLCHRNDHQPADVVCDGCWATADYLVRHGVTTTEGRHPEDQADRRRAPESGFAYDEWVARRRRGRS